MLLAMCMVAPSKEWTEAPCTRLTSVLFFSARFLSLHSVFEGELGEVIPVVHCSIAGTRIVGRLTAGMLRIARKAIRGGTNKKKSQRQTALPIS